MTSLCCASPLTRRSVSSSRPSKSLNTPTTWSCVARRPARSSAVFSPPGPGGHSASARRAWFFSRIACRMRSTRPRLRCGAMSTASWSSKTTAPTRSPWVKRRQRARAATSAAVTDFIALRVAKNIDSRWSTTRRPGRSRSSVYTRTCGSPRACGDLPVDRPHVVPGQVGADLLERHAAAAQPRRAAPGEQAVHGLVRQKGEPADPVLEGDEVRELSVDAGGVPSAGGEDGRNDASVHDGISCLRPRRRASGPRPRRGRP